MYTVLLVIHVLVTLALIGVILIQRSSGDGLVMGGGNQFMSGRATANLMTRTTAILATVFIGLSLILGIIGHGGARFSRCRHDSQCSINCGRPGPRTGGGAWLLIASA